MYGRVVVSGWLNLGAFDAQASRYDYNSQTD